MPTSEIKSIKQLVYDKSFSLLPKEKEHQNFVEVANLKLPLAFTLTVIYYFNYLSKNTISTLSEAIEIHLLHYICPIMSYFNLALSFLASV